MRGAGALSLHPHFARDLWNVVASDRGGSDQFCMGGVLLDGVVFAGNALSSAASVAGTASRNFPLLTIEETTAQAVAFGLEQNDDRFGRPSLFRARARLRASEGAWVV